MFNSKKPILLLVVIWLLSIATCWAEPTIPQGLVDSTPNKAILMNFQEWYSTSGKPNDPKISGTVIFSSPRSMVAFRDAGKGTIVPSHFHSTADEVLIITGGSGEILVNGEWVAVKPGDVHVNPRGIIHAARVLGNEDLQFVQVFAPIQSNGGDTNIVNYGDKVPVGLVSSSSDKAILLNFDAWYEANKKPEDPKISGAVIFSSPRLMVAFRDAGKGTVVPVHFHATADEILIITGGNGEILVNDEWVAVKAGDVHVNPRGVIHAARASENEDLRFVQIFTPLQPNGGDTNIIR